MVRVSSFSISSRFPLAESGQRREARNVRIQAERSADFVEFTATPRCHALSGLLYQFTQPPGTLTSVLLQSWSPVRVRLQISVRPAPTTAATCTSIRPPAASGSAQEPSESAGSTSRKHATSARQRKVRQSATAYLPIDQPSGGFRLWNARIGSSAHSEPHPQLFRDGKRWIATKSNRLRAR